MMPFNIIHEFIFATFSIVKPDLVDEVYLGEAKDYIWELFRCEVKMLTLNYVSFNSGTGFECCYCR